MKNTLFTILTLLLFVSCKQRYDYDELRVFNDYEAGLAQAKIENKPLLLYFTAHGLCGGCPFIEDENILGDRKVFNKLKNDFINIWLYVDDRRKIKNVEFEGEDSITIGSKWSKLQHETFNESSQPYFVIINANGEQISSKGIGYKAVRDGKLLDFLEQIK